MVIHTAECTLTSLLPPLDGRVSFRGHLFEPLHSSCGDVASVVTYSPGMTSSRRSNARVTRDEGWMSTNPVTVEKLIDAPSNQNRRVRPKNNFKLTRLPKFR